MRDTHVIIESREYRAAQERLLECPIFTEMLAEVSESELRRQIENDTFSINLMIRDEYRARGGKVQVHGLGDYWKAAELWLDR